MKINLRIRMHVGAEVIAYVILIVAAVVLA